ncbi:hypothetical protein EVG20_g9439 [Dentipellis fragilis]|uniref:Uncharacterized protein n=1 Tax=Dentipellis fragilis TaxID=205917 RepID=A0A4Y9Y163_9AGAM|nr:hypothetical protein EVG20_g9439 [Dentipellis fragilis]
MGMMGVPNIGRAIGQQGSGQAVPGVVNVPALRARVRVVAAFVLILAHTAGFRVYGDFRRLVSRLLCHKYCLCHHHHYQHLPSAPAIGPPSYFVFALRIAIDIDIAVLHPSPSYRHTVTRHPIYIVLHISPDICARARALSFVLSL